MIYGLYLSASGVLASSHRQDVIANNLANSETVGFKRDLAFFRQEQTEARKRGLSPNRHSNPVLEPLGGALNHAGTTTDLAQGALEATGTPSDLAIMGDGYFAVRDAGQTKLTRDGRLRLNAAGELVTASAGHRVLDEKLRPITLAQAPFQVGKEGSITQNGKVVGKVALFDVPDPAQLKKIGGNLLTYPAIDRQLRPADGEIVQGALERSNADPTRELAALMDAQRLLEANANMIRYQDQTLGRLVNDVGKIEPN